jgi:hypothetical protein
MRLTHQLWRSRNGVLSRLMPQSMPRKLFTESQTPARTAPTDPVRLKFLYVKENYKFEIHMELE